MNRVMICSFFPLWTPHFGTDLELAQKHLDEGDSVLFLHCNGSLPACTQNPSHRQAKCLECIMTRNKGLKMLSGTNILESRNFVNLTEKDLIEIKNLKRDFNNLNELEAFKLNEFDIGYAILSSIVSDLREPTPDLYAQKKNINNYFISALAVYKSISNYLYSESFDRVYVFNGRFAPVRGILRACQERKVKCFIHERGCDMKHYSLIEDTFPHDREYISRLIRKTWENSSESEEEKNKKGEEFFLNNFRRVVRNWKSFTEGQDEKMLPENWDKNKTNISIFISSEDELVGIGRIWQNPIYKNQNDGLTQIIRDMKDSLDDTHIYLRIHPNLKGLDNSQTRFLNLFNSPNLTIISPESAISSYTLIKNSSKVLTFGSTVGIEANYWGIPSILAAHSFYDKLDATYNPSTHDEVIKLLKDKNLKPKDKRNSLIYGYYFGTFGIEFKYFSSDGLFRGFFKGKNLRISSFWRLLTRVLIFPFVKELKITE